jgi:hypothetical protein
MIQIEETLNIKIHGINDCCKGILKSSGNYIWKFYCWESFRRYYTKIINNLVEILNRYFILVDSLWECYTFYVNEIM